MRREVAFSVVGQPRPKGSTRAFVPKGWTRPVVTAASPTTKHWEKAVHEAAQSEGFPVGGGGFRVRLAFVLPRPKRLAGKSAEHTSRPDVDKLCRCVLDALTGVAWKDDAQVTCLRATKRYARITEEPRVDIVFTEAME